jgi:hypothetical protein
MSCDCHNRTEYRMTGRTLDYIKMEHIAAGFMIGFLACIPFMMWLSWLVTPVRRAVL